jgi:hypothetical protein
VTQSASCSAGSATTTATPEPNGKFLNDFSRARAHTRAQERVSVRRAAANPIGRCVKLADLHDNSDLSRIAAPSERDFQRIEKYRRAIDLISRLPTCSDEPANAFASTVIADEQ